MSKSKKMTGRPRKVTIDRLKAGDRYEVEQDDFCSFYTVVYVNREQKEAVVKRYSEQTVSDRDFDVMRSEGAKIRFAGRAKR